MINHITYFILENYYECFPLILSVYLGIANSHSENILKIIIKFPTFTSIFDEYIETPPPKKKKIYQQ